MPKFLNCGAVLAVAGLTAVLAACSGSSTTAPSTAANQSSAPSANSGTPASTAPAMPESSVETATSIVTTTTVPTSAALPGDEKWHPVVKADNTDPALSPLVQSLIAGRPVDQITTGATSFYEARNYAVTFSEACDTTVAALIDHATAQGLRVIATGSLPTASWLVVSDGQLEGANLAFTPGTADGTCEMAGLPLTPVRITLDGPTAGTIHGFAAVGCGVAAGEGLTIGIWGAPITGQTGAASIWITTTDGTAPGPHTVREADQTYFSIGDTYTLSQLGAIATSGGNATLNTVTGTIVMSEGLASGTLDLTALGEHITGTFACGTPVYVPPEPAPTATT